MPCKCRCIDELIGGGFECGIVTQIYGASGTGKTNICIQLAVECVKNGQKVVFIDTDGFSPERFKQIAGDDTQKIAKDIIIYEPSSFEQQYASICDIEKMKDARIGLVILDSAAHFYRFGLSSEKDGNGQEENISARRELIYQMGILHRFARKQNAVVLISNQVYTDMDTGELCPVGGNALEHLSKTIIQLERVGNSRRRAILRKHRSQPEGTSCEFVITQQGLV